MIQLEALKEQLRLLGHDLPDEQIKSILAEMNVDVEAENTGPMPPAASTSYGSSCTSSAAGGTSSSYMQYTSAHTTSNLFPGQGAAAPRLAPVHEEDDCVVTHLSTEISDLDFMRACGQPISALGDKPASNSRGACVSTSYLSSCGFDAPSSSSMPVHSNTTAPAAYSLGGWADPGLVAGGSRYQPPQHASQTTGGTPPASTTHGSNGSGLKSGARRVPTHNIDSDDEDDDVSPLPDAYHGSTGVRGRVAARLYEDEDEEWDEVDEVDNILARYYGTTARNSSSGGGKQMGARPASAVDPEPVVSQLHGMNLGSRVWSAPAGRAGGSAPDNEAAMGSRRVEPRTVHSGAADSILRRVTSDSIHRPAPMPRPQKYKWHEDLRGDNAHDSRRADQTYRPSTATCSVAGSVRSAAPSQPKKVDRVARYQQLQKSWNKDKFLRNTSVDGAKSVASGAPKTTAVATTRKPLNFHAYFKALHAAEAADRRGMLQQTRAKTQADLAPGAKFVAVNDKRRDALRIETRTRMQQQSRPGWD